MPERYRETQVVLVVNNFAVSLIGSLAKQGVSGDLV
jgi:hypothetical protein